MTLIQGGMRVLPWPHERIKEGDQGKSRKQVLALEGARGTTLEAKRDQSGRSLPYIGMEALGSKFLIGVQ